MGWACSPSPACSAPGWRRRWPTCATSTRSRPRRWTTGAGATAAAKAGGKSFLQAPPLSLSAPLRLSSRLPRLVSPSRERPRLGCPGSTRTRWSPCQRRKRTAKADSQTASAAAAAATLLFFARCGAARSRGRRQTPAPCSRPSPLSEEEEEEEDRRSTTEAAPPASSCSPLLLSRPPLRHFCSITSSEARRCFLRRR